MLIRDSPRFASNTLNLILGFRRFSAYRSTHGESHIIFDATVDLESQFEAALAESKATGKKILVEYGGDWCVCGPSEWLWFSIDVSSYCSSNKVLSMSDVILIPTALQIMFALKFQSWSRFRTSLSSTLMEKFL